MNESEKHILIITPGFPADENDSTCLPMIQQYLMGFRKIHPDFNFTVVSLHYPYQTNEYDWNDIHVIPLGGSNLSGIAKLKLWRKASAKISEINKEMNFDIVHAFWLGEAALLAQRAAKKFHIPVICTLMGQDVLPENNYLPFMNFEKMKLVGLSNFQAEELWKTAARKVHKIIPWGIENQQYNFSNHRTIDLLGVGSLIPLKNFTFFINTVNKIRDIIPAIKAEIIGSGEEKQNLEELIVKLRLENNITLTGLLPHNEVMNKMQISRILLHTSEYEGFGFVFAEALANGMYIVSFKTGNTVPSGKWMVADSESEFLDKAEKLLRSDMNFEPINLFSIENTVESYYNYYMEIISDLKKNYE